MSVRKNLQKLLGVEPSRAVNKMGSGFFTPPKNKKNIFFLIIKKISQFNFYNCFKINPVFL